MEYREPSEKEKELLKQYVYRVLEELDTHFSEEVVNPQDMSIRQVQLNAIAYSTAAFIVKNYEIDSIDDVISNFIAMLLSILGKVVRGEKGKV